MVKGNRLAPLPSRASILHLPLLGGGWEGVFHIKPSSQLKAPNIRVE
ncbi:hypothetical protein DN35_3263 [Vibrio cholerae]|nr:hypothetical protein DN35_3263 [Vibrio cholerae]